MDIEPIETRVLCSVCDNSMALIGFQTQSRSDMILASNSCVEELQTPILKHQDLSCIRLI